MAVVLINSADTIQFTNVGVKKSDGDPTLLVQAGDWGAENASESGVVFDVAGNCAPLLTPSNARKLAQWLIRAADELDGVKAPKKKASRRHYSDEADLDDLM